MSEKKKTYRLNPDEVRDKWIHVRVSARQKERIKREAKACGMKPSTYLMALGSNYKPSYRLPPDQARKLDELYAFRDDIVKYTNAFSLYDEKARLNLFRRYSVMYEWLERIVNAEARVTAWLDSLMAPNPIPDRGEDAYHEVQSPHDYSKKEA